MNKNIMREIEKVLDLIEIALENKCKKVTLSSDSTNFKKLQSELELCNYILNKVFVHMEESILYGGK